jgi:hypothetical protein
MLRRSPMKRTPFKSRRIVKSEGPNVDREPRAMSRLPVVPNYGGTTTGPVAKEDVVESAAFENAVRDLGYCVRCGWIGRPQFCHRDQGKGAGIKTDVRSGWAGCSDCHSLLGGHAGGGRMPKAERRAEEDRLAAITRAELIRRRTWPKSVPMWEE